MQNVGANEGQLACAQANAHNHSQPSTRWGQLTMGLVWLVPAWLARGVPAPCMLTSELAGCAGAAGGTRFLGLYLQSPVAEGKVWSARTWAALVSHR